MSKSLPPEHADIDPGVWARKYFSAERLAEIQAASREAMAIRGDALALPLPRRAQFDPVRRLQELTVGPVLERVDAMLGQGASNMEISRALFEHPYARALLDQVGANRVSFETLVMVRRLNLARAPMMTLREALNQRLQDMSIGKNLPASLVRSPFPSFYVEFGPAEARERSPFRVHADGDLAICEGAMVCEYADIDPARLQPQVLRRAGLSSSEPLRMIEIAFSASPLGLEGARNSLLYDMCDLITLVIQDESRPIDEILGEHIALALERRGWARDPVGSHYGMTEQLARHFEANVEHLSKALLYIASDNREMREDNALESLQAHIAQMGAKKRAKARKRAERAYNRILVGSADAYVPLAERMAQIDGAGPGKGRKRPHFRRGYLGTRWIGPEGARKPALRWVRHTLVNAEGVPGLSLNPKDYDIR